MVTNIRDLQVRDDFIVTIAGTVTNVREDEFLLQDSTGQIWVDAIRRGSGTIDLAIGEQVTVTGDLDDLEDFDAIRITRADGSEVIGQPRPGNGRPGNGRPGNGRPGNGRPGNGRPENDRPVNLNAAPQVNIGNLQVRDDFLVTITGTVTQIRDDFQEGPGIRNWQFTSSGIKLLNVKNIVGGRVILDNSDKYISVDEFDQKYSHFLVEDGDIILASSGATYGKNAYFRDPGYRVIVNTSNIRLHPLDPARILQGYIKSFLDSPLFKQQVDRLITGAAQPNFGPSHLKQIQIPLPPIEEQERIVAEIEAEQRLVEANRELIERMEAKIADVLDRIWGTDEQADAAATSANV
ncbi:restriction endonuclease subunit S [Leptolyngbya sp. 7M]|uniref:restriction endonuclease subunit S n=1 Tax=Leptolyngbya sp. 7M TaxID=2812896 RepID=UPI001B8D5D8C|nr:restriction endonuclease subunit S [Leptolyngbya sp. 7M]QYO67408.1 restriction endonuclease subunit S [Leptolyngbya sp. 7M]